MADLTVAQALVVLWLSTLVVLIFGLVTLCVIVLIVVKHLTPKAPGVAPVPSFDKVVGGDPALNGYPGIEETTDEAKPDVASSPKVTQVLGIADQQSQGDRETWWEEKRQEGLSDEEIGELELSSVVDLGDR